MKINHIGIATNDIEKLTKEYINDGYELVNKVYDSIQLATLCLLKKEGQVDVELVYTTDSNSKVYNLSKNNYKREYHKCYEVDNINKSIKELKKEGYIVVSNIDEAILLNGKVCFLYRRGELIELVEKYE